MEVISKSVCLEDFRSRFNGKIPAIKDGKVLPYGYDGYSDYGAFPYDIKMFMNASKYKLLSLINKLCPIRSNFPCSVVKKKYILKYKTMVKDFKVIKDLIYGIRYNSMEYTYYKTLKYYRLCQKNGNMYWSEIDDNEWDEILKTDSESEYYNNNMRDEFKKFFYYDSMKMFYELPSPVIYYYIDTNNKINYVNNKESEITKYTYKDLDGKSITVDSLEEIPHYYEYIDTSTSITRKCYDLSDIENAVEWEEKEFEYEENKYTISSTKPFSINDVICVSEGLKKFFKIFSNNSDFSYIHCPSSNYTEVDSLPDISRNNYSKYYKLSDGKIYTLINNTDRVRYEYYFIEMVNEVLNKITDSNIISSSVNPFVEPFIGLNLYLEEEFNDNGLLNGYGEEWIPNKKYFIGDTVFYNNECYRLKEYETLAEYRSNGYLIAEEEVSKDYYNKNVKNKNIRYRLLQDKDGKCWLKTPYFKGYYDKTNRITYFDGYDDSSDKSVHHRNEIDSKGNYTHWVRTFMGVKDTTDDYYDNQFDPADKQEVTAVLESKLDSFLRYKKSFDDDGNEVPFNLIYKKDSDKAYSNTELRYRLGIQNTLTYNDTVFCDVMKEVDFYSGDETTRYEFTLNRQTISFPETGVTYYLSDYITGDITSYWRNITEFKVMVMEAHGDYLLKVVNSPTVYNDMEMESTLGENGGYITTYCDFSYGDHKPRASQQYAERDEADIYIPTDEGIMDAYYKDFVLRGTKTTYEGNVLLSSFTYSDYSVIRVNDIPSNAEYVEFKYTMRCRIGDDGTIEEGSGINYVDRYSFSIDEITENIADYAGTYCKWVLYDNSDGAITATTNTFGNATVGKIGTAYICNNDSLTGFESGKTYRCEAVFKYFSLGDSEITGSTENYGETNKAYSNVTFNGEILKYDDFQSVYGYKDESLVGVTNIVRNINVNIERGTSSALERHHILGEVNTLEDLVNYRNNFFDL